MSIVPNDVSTSREWSVEAYGGHGNNPRERLNHGAAKHGLGVNPSEALKSSVSAPSPRAPLGPSDDRDGLGLTAVAYSTTLSVKKFSVSLRISNCGLTNMAMSHIPPSSRQTRQSRRKKKAAALYLEERVETSYLDGNRYATCAEASFST